MYGVCERERDSNARLLGTYRFVRCCWSRLQLQLVYTTATTTPIVFVIAGAAVVVHHELLSTHWGHTVLFHYIMYGDRERERVMLACWGNTVLFRYIMNGERERDSNARLLGTYRFVRCC